MALTVRQFVLQMYTLISASNPTIPLHGDDESLAVRVLNQIMQSYASSGLMITIAKTVSVGVNLPVKEILFVDPSYPTETVQTVVGNLTSGSPDFLVSNPALYLPGDAVSGAGILAGTVIASININTVTLSTDAFLTVNTILTITRDITVPNVAYIKQGRLANLDSAWLQLSGVTYPLIDKSRDEYLAAWKYEPLQGLPRFIITFPEVDLVRATLYPAPSQFYTFFARGKFQLPRLTVNDDMSLVPEYYHLYFLYATAKYVSKFKGRGGAWTPDLEAEYRELKDNMEAASEVNLSIAGDEQSLLNGAWRVRAGI